MLKTKVRNLMKIPKIIVTVPLAVLQRDTAPQKWFAGNTVRESATPPSTPSQYFYIDETLNMLKSVPSTMSLT